MREFAIADGRGTAEASTAVELLIRGNLTNHEGEPTRTLVVYGPPCTGKTTFALESMLAGIRAFGDTDTVMVVSQRKAAAELSQKIIRRTQVSEQIRPVGTLAALAFKLVSEARAAQSQSLPKLLNGAEQDALLRRVLAKHIQHVLRGDDCASCRLLARYFGEVGHHVQETSWITVLAPGVTNFHGNTANIADTTAIMAAINDDFAAQLRDMIARMNELGLSHHQEHHIREMLSGQRLSFPQRERLDTQWSLAFQLWREYAHEIATRYPDEFRLDASRLLVAATRAASQCEMPSIPRFIVIDDWQDLTLAGMSFIQTLSTRGSRLVLIGNSDESVQSFRGAYPEFLGSRVTTSPSASSHSRLSQREDGASLVNDTLGRLSAAQRSLDFQPLIRSHALQSDHMSASTQHDSTIPSHSYADVLASRVSLSITSETQSDIAIARRPGKLPQWEATLPVVRLKGDEEHASLDTDGSVMTRIFRTPQAEMDDMLWQIQRETATQSHDWNDMAVIAHDNATVRAFGERLREQGIPVRYSAVTRPLHDEATVAGLFALVQLVDLRTDKPDVVDARSQASWASARLRTLLSSPLIATHRGASQERRPVRIQRIESVLDSCCALFTVSDETDHDSTLALIRRHICDWVEDVDTKVNAAEQAQGITIEYAGLKKATPLHITREFLCAQLVVADDQLATKIIATLNAIAAGNGKDDDVQALAHAAKIIRSCATAAQQFTQSNTVQRFGSLAADIALWTAWDACGVAEQWQEEALQPGIAGELANDRLDAMMRLFQLASESAASINVNDYMEQIRGMQIEADSLAHIGPIEHAVTLTTPAGALAQAKRWPIVWMPSIQQGTWPNMSERDTLFGTQEMANIVLYRNIDGDIGGNWDASQGGIEAHATSASVQEDVAVGQTYSHARLISTLNAEKKSFLVSLTRAEEQIRISAVCNSDTLPSDLLYDMLPERFEAMKDLAQLHYTEPGDGPQSNKQWSGMETSVTGLVTIARAQLGQYVIEHPQNQAIDEKSRDSVQTLRMLAKHGHAQANPSSWPFVYCTDIDGISPTVSSPNSNPVINDNAMPINDSRQSVVLTPSAVDAIWKCPLEWVLDTQFTGPTPSNINLQFGTMIHRVAELATNEGLDRLALPSSQIAMNEQGSSLAALKDHIAQRMEHMFAEIVEAQTASRHPQDLYLSASKRRLVPKLMHNIASYYVQSCQPEYAQQGSTPIHIGTLLDAQAELPFDVSISVDDVLPIWNNTFPEHRVNAHELFSLMSALSGGFMPSMREDCVIRLTGRIDRLEHRQLADTVAVRIIDYKTGRAHSSKDSFNDLQLICYQLATLFDKQTATKAKTIKQVSQAALFDVACNDAPAYSHVPESLYQPGMIVDGKFNTVYEARAYYPRIDTLLDFCELPTHPPIGVDEKLWKHVLQHQHTQAIWALTMISRVFFAASVRQSSHDERMELDAARCRKGAVDANGETTCKAWQLLHSNVMEERR